MKIKFFKMHGCGNDYVFIDARSIYVKNPNELAVFVSKRRFSVGSDGLVLITRSNASDCGMRIYNADGSEGTTCGNALRCVAKYLYSSDSSVEKKREFKIETLSGVRSATVIDEDTIFVEMGKAAFRADNLPPFGVLTMPYNGREFNFFPASVGNPHAVAFVDDFNFDLNKVAEELCNGGIYPDGANVEFAVKDGDGYFVRVIERGSGETLCCGSGACAVAATACRVGLQKFGEVPVRFKGGNLKISVDEEFNISMSGPAIFVFKGELFYE